MAPKKDPTIRISESEWLVMQTLWEKAPRLAQEIADSLEERTRWNHRTVKTLIGRLVKKGAIRFDKSDRKYLYYPCVDEKTCVIAETRSFLGRVYGGAFAPMLAAFLDQQSLSREEIDTLKKILERRKEK